MSHFLSRTTHSLIGSAIHQGMEEEAGTQKNQSNDYYTSGVNIIIYTNQRTTNESFGGQNRLYGQSWKISGRGGGGGGGGGPLATTACTSHITAARGQPQADVALI